MSLSVPVQTAAGARGQLGVPHGMIELRVPVAPASPLDGGCAPGLRRHDPTWRVANAGDRLELGPRRRIKDRQRLSSWTHRVEPAAVAAQPQVKKSAAGSKCADLVTRVCVVDPDLVSDVLICPGRRS